MEFSNRVKDLKPEGAYTVMTRALELEKDGRDILHLEIGQPDFQTAPHISQAGIDAINSGYTRYNPPSGVNMIREAIARDAGRRRRMNISPEQVVVGPGAKPGLFFTTLALVAPGDRVLYPDPGFPTYEAMILAAGGIPVPVPLKETNRFSFNLDIFDSLMDDRVKMIILNSPANPTGGIMPRADLSHVAEAAKQWDAWVLSDEIYARLVYDGLVSPSIAREPDMMDRTIIVDGFSKTYAMTGWRLGYLIAPLELARRMDLVMTHAVGCTATFTQYAGISALEGPQDQVDDVIREYQKRRDLMVDGLNAIPGVSCQRPQGAFYAFPNIRETGWTSSDLSMALLEKAGVACLSGTDFGRNGEGYLRLCYATSPEIIENALHRIENFISQVPSAC